MNVQCIPTAWHNQINVVIVIDRAWPVPQIDVVPGRGRWLRDLAPRRPVERAPRRPVERAPRRSPAGHPEHTAAGRDSIRTPINKKDIQC